MKKYGYAALALSAAMALSTGCSVSDRVKLDPDNPVTVTVWHYYNGTLKSAFDNMVQSFNDTVGLEEGIIVEGRSYGDVTELENAVTGAINKAVGSDELPSIFSSYADMAFYAEQKDVLASLDSYFTSEEQDEYIDSYLEEGRIGKNGELKIFPVAKSTEILMLNKTDWDVFTADTGFTYDNLRTKEGLVEVAEKYYEWTDAQTPDIPEDGKAFYGRDAMANYFVVGTKQLGQEIFSADGNGSVFNTDEAAMRRLWDCYYVPYINGYFYSNGRYRSDDAKVGDILALTGSSASAAYFPKEVTIGTQVHEIEAQMLPAPVFEGGDNVNVQQGAGMVVTKSTPEVEYASVKFLKWFTDNENNIVFSALSGYLPVKKSANIYEDYSAVIAADSSVTINKNMDATVKTAFDYINGGKLYTYKAFENGTSARNVLNTSLSDKAAADRAAVLESIAGGMTRAEAVAQFDTDENFRSWLEEFRTALDESVK